MAMCTGVHYVVVCRCGLPAATMSFQNGASHVITQPGASPRGGLGWTGVDMSTPLLPEVVPEIDANPVSFYSGGGGWVDHGLELEE